MCDIIVVMLILSSLNVLIIITSSNIVILARCTPMLTIVSVRVVFNDLFLVHLGVHLLHLGYLEVLVTLYKFICLEYDINELLIF